MLIKRDNLPTLSRSGLNTPLSLSNWLDDIFDDVLNWTDGTFVPELNVYETAREFEVTVELPGMDKNDFDISLNDNVLTISGERRIKGNGKENGRTYHRVESRFGRFRRSLPLPNIVDMDKIEAHYENGVLAVTIPKLKEKAGRKIKIK